MKCIQKVYAAAGMLYTLHISRVCLMHVVYIVMMHRTPRTCATGRVPAERGHPAGQLLLQLQRVQLYIHVVT